MDIISHILIGKIISFFDRKNKTAGFWAMLFSFLPDLSQVPFYIYLGVKNMRLFVFPYNADWNTARGFYPFLTALWEISHSFFFLLLIILPVIMFLKLPKIAFFAYFFHIIIDIFTHAGEWSIKPFYPISYTIGGITNAWAWPAIAFFYSWTILSLVIISLTIFFKKKNNALSSDRN